MMGTWHRCVTTVAVFWAGLSAPALTWGQGAPARGLGIAVDAQGGVFAPWENVRSSRVGGPLFGVVRAGVGVHQDAGLFTVDGALDVASASAAGARMTQPLGRLRVATQRGLVTFSLGIEQNVGTVVPQRRTGATPAGGAGDTLGAADPGSGPFGGTGPDGARLVRATDVVGGLGWHSQVAGLRVLGLGGVRVNDFRNGAWLGGDASVGIGAASMLTLAVRYQSSRAMVRMPAVALGVRTAYWRWGNGGKTDANRRAGTTPVVRVLVVGDTVRLSLQLRGASSAALMGDATEWRPVLMSRGVDGWWSASVCVHDAVSRIQLRVDDGAWRPVPGLPAVRDEYGTMVSLLGDTPK